VEELVEKVAVFPDHLEVTIAGAPKLNVGLSEAGLGSNQSQNVSVGGGTRYKTPRRVATVALWLPPG
jgi:hypothetical protein